MGFVWGLALVFGLTLGIGYSVLLNWIPAIVWYVIAAIGLAGLWQAKFLRTT